MMNAPSTPGPAPSRVSRSGVALCCVGIVLAVLVAYCRSYGGSFVYDDVDSISRNVSIRHFSTALSPPDGTTVSGRPILNLSFAINYAVSGNEVWSYHALNVAIHALAALLLFGIVRRSLASRPAGSRSAAECLGVAFAVALLWAVHPVQAESVAYVVQRAESLMGLFYLLTLYAFIRSAEPGSAGAPWAATACAACLLGMGTKEVMVTAPVVVLLYDRTFLSGTFRGAWRRRGALHGALMACWLALAPLVLRSGGRSGTAGFGSGVAWWAYCLAQFRAVAHYIRLAVWPHPLVADYGRVMGGSPAEVLVDALIVVSLASGAFVLLRRRSTVGFLGASFFLILAPSSSVIPVSTEIIAEHRMYLPLAAAVTLGVLAMRAALDRRPLFLASVGALAVVLGALTFRRVRVYKNAVAFWGDVAAKVPGNAGAWNNLGIIQAEKGDQESATAHFRRALRLAPAFALAHANLGRSLVKTGHPVEAAKEFEDALAYLPDDPSVHFGYACALALEKRGYAAAAEFREALRLDPGRADAWSGLGSAMVQVGNLPTAADAYSHAVRMSPDDGSARVAYGDSLAQLGRTAEAIREYREALRLEPGAADVHNNLGGLLAESGNLAEARAQFEEALRLKPDYAAARDNLGRVRALENRAGNTP
jgi:Flp pilus assembly protein TadD